MPPIAQQARAQTFGTPLDQLAPDKSGWHLLQFVDGTVGVVRYDGGKWQWGSQQSSIPPSNVQSMSFLGGDVTAASVNLSHYATQVGAKVSMILRASMDHGTLSKGQPLIVSSSGAIPSGASQTGGEATPINQIPSPLDPNIGNTGGGLLGSLGSIPFLSLLGTMSFWKGIGLVIAGALVLIFAAIEFLHVGGGSLPKVGV